jgi:hypothetical protein
MAGPICGVAGSTCMLSATVLSVKVTYKFTEFGVLLHKSGAVVSLRDVKIFTPEAVRSQGPASGLLGVGYAFNDIKEGTPILINDVGTWNPVTTALHNARVTITGLSVPVIRRASNANSNNPDYTGGHNSNRQNGSAVSRRKGASMNDY